MLCASSTEKWTGFGLGWLVPVVSKPDFAVLATSRIPISRLAWMPHLERVSARDVAAAWLWHGQLLQNCGHKALNHPMG